MLQSLHNVLAPAKLNLFLHITGRRADGYHLLQSVFMLIDWCDTLHFDLELDGTIQRIDLNTPLPADDLTVRAARALQSASGTTLGAEIRIDKQIPAQAGMGGGSSDAASTLLALNKLWGLNWTVSQLLPIGLALGADVPFFLHGYNAWVEGIGEKISPVLVPPSRFVVVKPNAGIETARIFGSAALERTTKTATISDFAAQPYDFGRNDLQPVAQALCPEVETALQWLQSLGLKPRMTGSGSAVFAQLPEHTVVDNPPHNWKVQTCRNMVSHPLREWMDSNG
jgi:4-diphosphocytidyl-2-C-methyl-D-erythritol kinase